MVIGAPVYSISHFKAERILRLNWLSGTSKMSDGDFRDALWLFATGSARHHAPRLIIDMTEFKHRPAEDVMTWRDEVIVPMYLQAGVRQIAWIWPGETGSRMTASGGASYENRYFGTEDEAISWLLSGS
jgi:hypothetical protein